MDPTLPRWVRWAPLTKAFANAVNNSGQIVGSSALNSNDNATIWQGSGPNGESVAVNLNSFLTPSETQAGWVLTSATGISNEGWIVGDAYNSKTGADDAFLLKGEPGAGAGELCDDVGRHRLDWSICAAQSRARLGAELSKALLHQRGPGAEGGSVIPAVRYREWARSLVRGKLYGSLAMNMGGIEYR